MTGLAQHAETIARALLGEPNCDLSSRSQLRFGNRSSLAVEIEGRKAGQWFDHETETGGGLLDLIVRERGGTKADAMAWIKSSLGIEIRVDGAGGVPPRRRVAEYVYHDRNGEPLYRVVRWFPKSFTQERYDATSWVTGKECMRGVERVPYRLPEWGSDRSAPVFIVEGEKDCDRLTHLGAHATTNPGGAGKWVPTFAPYFADHDVVIVPDNDDAGLDHARAVAANLQPVARSVRVVELPGLPPKGDVTDWLAAGGSVAELMRLAAATTPEIKGDRAADIAEIERLIEHATNDPGAPFEAVAVDFLAALRVRDRAAYERTRARLKKVNVRVGELDQEIERRQQADGPDAKGKALDLFEPEPWGESVDGAELVAALVEQIRRYVILPDHAALATALWVLHCHAHAAAFHSPRLTITSPTMRCGKSTLLRVIARLAPRPLATANITPAALFRVIEAAKPCLMIDEADSFAHDNEELRGIVNSSHCVLDAFVVRAVPAGDDYEARRFSTWAPMAIASIGRIASTIADRSVIIAMERKAPGETIARMRADRDDGFGVLASKAARWTADHIEALRQADPDVPSGLNDRQADNWRELLAIASLCCGEWPTRAWASALALSVIDEDAENIGVQLLADIKIVLDGTMAESIWTEDLLRHLHAMAERPWPEYGRQRKPISPRQLASLLKPFGIVSRQLGKRDGTAVTNKHGFARVQFSAAWSRYANTLTTKEPATFSDFPSANTDSLLADTNPPKAAETASVSVLADSEPLAGRNGEERTINDAGEGEAGLPDCAYCHKSIAVDAGRYTATSSGEYLHNSCVDEWAKA
jgi:putative DNA primase/helicase